MQNRSPAQGMPKGATQAPQDLQVLAAAFYAARFADDWQPLPYWMLRRCVVPYVAVSQFLLLRRDGVPVAFAGWACERPGQPAPWRADRFLPSAGLIAGPGACIVTDIISGLMAPEQVAAQVGRYLGLNSVPPWIEWGSQRSLVALHPGGTAAPQP